MKQNERILVYLVTGFLAVILVVAVVFGNDGKKANRELDGKVPARGLDEILALDPIDTGDDAGAKDDGAGSGEVSGGDAVAKSPLVAGVVPSASERIARLLGPSERDRTVRKVVARRGDSLSALVQRWCGGLRLGERDLLSETYALNETLRVLRAGQTVIVPWVDDELVLAAYEARRPKMMASAANASGAAASGPVDAAATSLEPTFLEPGAGRPAASSAPVSAAGTETYVVRSGDSLWKIAAARYGKKRASAMVREIKGLNPGLDERIDIGQKIVVPAR